MYTNLAMSNQVYGSFTDTRDLNKLIESLNDVKASVDAIPPFSAFSLDIIPSEPKNLGSLESKWSSIFSDTLNISSMVLSDLLNKISFEGGTNIIDISKGGYSLDFSVDNEIISSLTESGFTTYTNDTYGYILRSKTGSQEIWGIGTHPDQGMAFANNTGLEDIYLKLNKVPEQIEFHKKAIFNKAVIEGVLRIDDTSDLDMIDVSGCNILYVDTSNAAISIDKLMGSEANQRLTIIKKGSANSLTLINESAFDNTVFTEHQNITLAGQADLIIGTAQQAVTLINNGLNWEQIIF